MIKPIPNFIGYYADDDGKIYSKWRRAKGGVRGAKEIGDELKEMKQQKIPKCYPIISLYKNKKQHVLLVHRLVAQTFLENPKKLPLVMHLDDNKQNNILSNLKWATYSENIKSAFDKGRKTVLKGEKNKSSKLNEKQVRVIKYLKKINNISQSAVANIFKVHQSTISNIWNGRRNSWAHVTI